MRPVRPVEGSGASPQAARRFVREALAKGEGKRRKPEPICAAVVEAMKPPPGRTSPTSLTPKLAEHILAEMWRGRFLTAICRDPGMPTRRSVQRWVALHPEFRRDFQIARLALADALFDQLLEIADDVSQDRNAQGFPDNAAVQRAKLRVDTRKWIVCKIAPHLYGDRVEHVGEVMHRHMIDRPPEETREQWLSRRRAELALPAPTVEAPQP